MSKDLNAQALLVAILAFVLGLRIVTFTQPHFVSGQKVKINAVLGQEPRFSSQTQSFVLANVPVKAWRYPEFHYGDKLELIGIVKDNKLEFPQIQKMDEEGGFFPWVGSLRRKIEDIYKMSLPEPQASLISGIVLGSKQDMPDEFYSSLQKTGTLHIIVASGMNVAIVAGTLVSFLVLFFRRTLALIFAFLGIWFYVVLSGAEIPVVRAGIMASFAYLAQGLGRPYDGWRGLALAVYVLLLINPASYLDLGFQLSFAATGGILFFGPRFSTLFLKVPEKIRGDLAQTLGAQTATTPLIFLNFGQFSLLSPIANILVVSILSYLMKLGALVAILGLILKPLGQILAWFLWPFLTYFIKVVELFAGI